MGLTIENVVEVFLKCSLLSFQLFGETLSVKPPLFFMPLVVGLKKLIWVIHRRHRPLLHWRIPIATHGMVHGRSNTKGIWGPHHLALMREVCRRGWGHVPSVRWVGGVDATGGEAVDCPSVRQISVINSRWVSKRCGRSWTGLCSVKAHRQEWGGVKPCRVNNVGPRSTSSRAVDARLA